MYGENKYSHVHIGMVNIPGVE